MTYYAWVLSNDQQFNNTVTSAPNEFNDLYFLGQGGSINNQTMLMYVFDANTGTELSTSDWWYYLGVYGIPNGLDGTSALQMISNCNEGSGQNIAGYPNYYGGCFDFHRGGSNLYSGVLGSYVNPIVVITGQDDGSMDCSGFALSQCISSYQNSGTNFSMTQLNIGPPPPTFFGLAQYQSDGITPIMFGETLAQNIVDFTAKLQSFGTSTSQLQIEIQPINTPFVNQPNLSSSFVPSGNTAIASSSALANGPYHWQARVVDSYGNATAWQGFGAPNGVALTIDTTFVPHPGQPSYQTNYPSYYEWVLNDGNFTQSNMTADSAPDKYNDLYFWGLGGSINGQTLLMYVYDYETGVQFSTSSWFYFLGEYGTPYGLDGGSALQMMSNCSEGSGQNIAGYPNYYVGCPTYHLGGSNLYLGLFGSYQMPLVIVTAQGDGSVNCSGISLDQCVNSYQSIGTNFSTVELYPQPPPPPTGTITVSSNADAATFTVTGPSNFSGGGPTATFTNAPAGQYTINFGAVPGYITPPQQTQTLTEGGAITFTGAYSTPVLGPGGSTQNPVVMYAEPVDTQSGNYFYQHTDINISGRGMALSLSRSYNALASYSGPLGSNWTHSYNVALTDAGRSLSVTWGDGHTEIYLLSAGVYYPTPGVYNAVVKNADGSYVVTQKDQTQYNFGTQGKLTSVVDKNGNQILCSYDGTGNLTKITDTVGRPMTLTYDKSNRIIKIVDPIGRKESFKYSANNDLATVTDPLNGVTSFTYDTAHHVETITLPGKIPLLTNVYDSSGRVISQTNGNKFTTTFSYGIPAAGQTTITDPLGNTIVHSYDNNLRIVQITDALNGTMSYGYDQNNNRIGVTNQNGKTTTFTYDSMGNVTGISDPLGDQTSFSYDAKNDLTTSTNANGKSAIFTYDGNGNMTTTQDALSNVTKFGYDSFGELTSKTDANNHTTNHAYDAYGNLTTITDALNDATTMGYDGIGRLTSVTDANGHTMTSSYDALSRVVGTTDALGDATRFKYSAVGNLAQVTDANNNATTYAYDAVNNLTMVTDAAKHITKYLYDANNNRISFTNARGKKTTYAYDKLNRLSTTTDPLLLATVYSYDPVGNIASITDANGHATQFTYDAVNRLTGISYFDGTTVGYAYDPDGNRTSMTDSHGATSYTYDPLDRVNGVVQPGGATVAYSYDAVGHRISLNYPDSKAASYSYDAANRLSNVTDWLNRTSVYSYDPANRLLGTNYPNTASISYAYDSANRLTNVSNTYPASAIGPTGQFSAFTYSLDKVGNRVSVADGNGSTTSYTYDPLYELTSATNAFGSTKYTYDAFGNRLTLASPSGTTTYKYDNNDRLLSAGKTSFTYDKNGNRITEKAAGQTLAYAYDAANRLTSVTGGTQSSTFAYDGDGHRVSQAVPAGTYTYVNDVASSLPVVLQENGPDGFISYDYGLGLISESSASFDYFYHVDGLNSTVGLTDTSGSLDQGYVYDPWGNNAGAPDYVGTANKFRYTGQALDSGSLLYYLRARYLDGGGGRFISGDPIGHSTRFPLAANRYAYALSNPVRYSDATGLGWFDTVLDFSLGYKTGQQALSEYETEVQCAENTGSGCTLNDTNVNNTSQKQVKALNYLRAGGEEAGGTIYNGTNVIGPGSASTAFDFVVSAITANQLLKDVSAIPGKLIDLFTPGVAKAATVQNADSSGAPSK